jgi:serine/threonine protein phosphatase 1
MPEYSHHLRLADEPALIYAIGDIHGMLSKLRAVIARCEKHAAGRPMTLVFLGDYIDRGPDSRGVLETIMKLRSERGDRVVALKGNHEALTVEIFDGLARPKLWLEQGGVETLRSYGVKSARNLPREHIEWLRALPHYHDDGRRFFVHAGIDPDKPLAEQTERDLLWIRDRFLNDKRDHGRLVVHGHTPRTDGEPDLRSNRLNLDTGAVFGGPLTAAVFASKERDPIGFLQVD